MRVLLVEDTPLLQYIHKIMLTKSMALAKLQGEVEVAGSGEEALELAKEYSYDLIFLDIRLPGINGIETARRLRLLEKHSQTRLIALTTNYEGDTAKDCLSAGIETVLSKPTSMEKLKATLCNIAT